MSSSNVSVKVRLEQIQLLIRGSGILLCMLVLSAVYLGYEAQWRVVLQGQQDAQLLVPQLSQFLNSLRDESAARATLPLSPTAVAAAQAVSDATWGALSASLTSNSQSTAVVETHRAAYRLAKYVPAMLQSHQQIVADVVALGYNVQRSQATTRLQQTLDHLAGQNLAWRYTSLASRAALLHRSHVSGDSPTATEIDSLGKAQAAFKEASNFAPSSFNALVPSAVSLDAAAILVNCTKPNSAIVNSSVTSIIVSTSQASLAALSSYAGAGALSALNSGTSASTIKVIVFAVGVALSLAILVASVVIFLRHSAHTKRAVALVEAFGDADRSRDMIQAYKPILCQMRTNVTIPPADTEVEREYLFAARVVQQLRPLIPQALFGELNNHHKKEPNGSWDITSQPIRVEMGLAFCHCHVLTITFSSENTINATKGRLGAVLVEASNVMYIVTEEVNNSGGIVCGVAPDGRITCVWNATNIVESGAFVAVRTARAIDKRLNAINIQHDLNIATGPSIVANTKVGTHHKHVTFIGGAFEVGEKLLLLNESHSSRLVIDSDTFKELPRDFQRSCKPIAVLRDKDEAAVVAVAADAECTIKGDQWKQYNTAFTLYQNNMNSEALNEFKKYLATYPDDDAAQWLVQNVLEKSATKRSSVVINHRPSSARGTSSNRLR